MPFIEAPTTFYMGRQFDPATRRLLDEVIYYDSRDLTTHAVVVGMTGSGKTGLCITLLEEAVMDDIPAIIIDPKGDITNLMLAFPELRPQDFEPWVNVDDARRAGVDLPEFAQQTAQKWREGLAAWGISAQRVQFFKNNARFSIYTPGSDAGLPISILDAMQAPRGGWLPGDDEFHRERISGITTALLALVGRNVEPVRDREHVLIANIFESAWRLGRDLTLEDVILQVQKPPFAKLGVFDVDTFFPEKERFALAMDLNNIIASPSFQSWIQGEPMDIQSLLYTPEGRPRVSIFYIAHLSDAERMFIVTLLLENMLAWMRTLSGTTSLRALLYFDEVFGFFPSHPYNPPSKEPILRMLKQARAFGLGLVLATQNPADIDYKGLANAGTWFIGKLQTENDRNKVLSGLQNITTVDSVNQIRDIGRLLNSIDPRVFVMHNVHDRRGPIPIHTRWAMSFLRGPLTRQQIRILMADQRAQPVYAPPALTAPPQAPPAAHYRAVPMPSVLPGATPPPLTLPELPPSLPELPGAGAYPPVARTGPSVGVTNDPATTRPPQPFDAATVVPPQQRTAAPISVTRTGPTGPAPIPGLPQGYSLTPPPLASSVTQYFLPAQVPVGQAVSEWTQRTGMRPDSAIGDRLAYEPVLLAQAEVRYADRKSGISLIQEYTYTVTDVERAGLVRWDEYAAPYVDPRTLGAGPDREAAYGPLAVGLSDPRRLTALKNELVDFVYKTASVVLLHNPALDLYGDPEMQRRDFLVQAHAAARQRRDQEADAIAARYDGKFDAVEARLRKAARDLAAEQKQLDSLKGEELFTAGEAALSLLRGRTTYTLSRVSRTRRYRQQAQEDIYGAEQVIAELEAQLDELQGELERELARLDQKWNAVAQNVGEYRITPLKKDISLSLFGIGWLPHWVLIARGTPALVAAW